MFDTNPFLIMLEVSVAKQGVSNSLIVNLKSAQFPWNLHSTLKTNTLDLVQKNSTCIYYQRNKSRLISVFSLLSYTTDHLECIIFEQRQIVFFQCAFCSVVLTSALYICRVRYWSLIFGGIPQVQRVTACHVSFLILRVHVSQSQYDKNLSLSCCPDGPRSNHV